MAVSICVGSIEIDSTIDEITVDGSDVSLTQGRYYLYDPQEGAKSLIHHLASVMTAEHGTTITPLLYEDGNIRFSCANNFSYEFPSYIANMLGISTSGSGASSYTGSSRLGRSWFPHTLLAKMDTPTDQTGFARPLTTQTESPEGSVWTQRWGLTYRNTIYFVFVNEAYVSEGSTQGTYYSFWEDALSRGNEFVFMPSFSTDSSPAPSDWHYFKPNLLDSHEPFMPSRSIEDTDAFWDIRIPVLGGNL